MSRRWEDMNERERWLIQVEEKMKRGNQILFDRNSVLLQPLIDLLCVQNRRAVVLWCLDGMEEILERIRLIDPTETRAEEAVRQCRLWAAGEIRMPQAKKAILAAHAIAKESDDPVLGAYAHAIGQGCGSVHCETHAIGMVIYALTALVRAHGLASCQEVIEARVREEEERLSVWQLREKQEKWTWAPFLMKERPNKELERKRKRQAAREG